MKKQFFAAAMILALGAGFTACSSDDLNVKSGQQTEIGNEKVQTYLSFAFTLPAPTSQTRATDDGQTGDSPSYNFIETWEGMDQVKKARVYIFAGSGTLAPLEKTQDLVEADFTSSTTAGKTTFKANKAVSVQPGNKTVYVVVNNTTKSDALLSGQTLAEFKAQYEGSDLAFDAAPTAYSATMKTVAEQIATYSTTDSKDQILMTGPGVVQSIAANVDETTAKTGTTAAQNRVVVNVQRAVARVVVTQKKDNSYTIAGFNPTSGVKENDYYTVSKLYFSEAQGEKKLYFLQKPSTDTGTGFQSVYYSIVPSSTTYSTVGAYYDYSGLLRNSQKGLEVPQYADGKLVAGKSATFFSGHQGVFILPNTHKWAGTAAVSDYRKGNTAYVVIRAFGKPKYVATAANDANHTFTWTENWISPTQTATKVFLGDDDRFYASKELAQKAVQWATSSATAKQKTREFAVTSDGVKMIYFAWINPDVSDPTKWTVSPVLRNNIYHLSIADITKFGSNYNPLVPRGTTNPDPKPNNPDEPENPNKPEDPLSFKDTYMAVSATILPWKVHSTEITF